MMKKISLSIIGLLFSACLYGQISVKTGVDKSSIHIGDYIHYYIMINYSKDLKLDLPAPGSELGQFDIVDYSVSDIKTKETNTLEKMVTYKISAYLLGEFEIPSIEIGYADRNGKQDKIRTEPILIKVVPLERKPSDTEDIRDLKKQISLPDYFWLILLSLLLLAGAGAWVYFRFLKGKLSRPQEIPETAVPILSEDEEALEKIRQLQAKDYLKNDKIKEYYFELNEIIRAYLHRRYDIQTLERTTWEILRDLKKVLSKDVLEVFTAFFTDTDMVKFAKYLPTINELNNITPLAIDLIQSTKRSTPVNNEMV